MAISSGWKGPNVTNVCAKIRSSTQAFPCLTGWQPRLVLLLFRMNSAMQVMWKPRFERQGSNMMSPSLDCGATNTQRIGVTAVPKINWKPRNDESNLPASPSSHSSAQPKVVDPPAAKRTGTWVKWLELNWSVLYLSECVKRQNLQEIYNRTWF